MAALLPTTMPVYSSRGPRLPDSALKPDVTAPAEVVGVATNRSGSAVAELQRHFIGDTARLGRDGAVETAASHLVGAGIECADL